MQGKTLLVNLYEAPESILTDENVLKLMLRRLIESAEMTPLEWSFKCAHFPIPYGNKWKGGYGISAGMLLVESHVYIHTWPEEGFARLELSSCKDFDETKVLQALKIFVGRDCKIKFEVVSWED